MVNDRPEVFYSVEGNDALLILAPGVCAIIFEVPQRPSVLKGMPLGRCSCRGFNFETGTPTTAILFGGWQLWLADVIATTTVVGTTVVG